MALFYAAVALVGVYMIPRSLALFLKCTEYSQRSEEQFPHFKSKSYSNI